MRFSYVSARRQDIPEISPKAFAAQWGITLWAREAQTRPLGPMQPRNGETTSGKNGKKNRNFRKRIITCYNQPVEEDHFLGFGRFSFVSKSVCFCWDFVKVLLCFFCTLMHTQNEKWYALCIYIYTYTYILYVYIYTYIYINMMYSYISNHLKPSELWTWTNAFLDG